MSTTHPTSECDQCDEALKSAETHARVTGSVGATVRYETTDGGEHAATWTRPAPAAPPAFGLVDNGDGTATVFDGGIAVCTIERERGVYEPDRAFGGAYVSLQYVARGHETRAADPDNKYTDHIFRVGVASSTVDVSSGANPDDVKTLMAAARPLYIAGRIRDLQRAHEAGNLADDYADQIAEWLPKWRANGEADLADAMEAFADEVRSA